MFGGGTGAGVSINPIAFIVISKGSAKVLSIDTPNSTVAEKALALAPDLVDKITAIFNKENGKDNQEEEKADFPKEESSDEKSE